MPEDAMAGSEFRYTTYIRTTPAELWAALVDPERIRRYWFGVRTESDFTPGAAWRNVSPGGEVLDDGEIVDAEPQRRLSIRWRHRLKPELVAEGDSLCTMELEPVEGAVRLTIRHASERDASRLVEAVSVGWPKVVSNLKSLLETGSAVLQQPYPA
jgi:uncharacterized protein YndB with AHSA1/START domain